MSDSQVFNFSILSKELSKELSICNLVSPKKSEIDLFTSTRVQFSVDGLSLTATNGSLYYSVKLKLGNSQLIPNDYLFLVKTDAFANILGLISDEMVEIDVNLDKLTMLIKGTKAKHQLRLSKENAGDFKIPELSNSVSVRMRLKTEEMLEANKACLISVGQAKSMYQPEFWNICYTALPKINKLNIVSTDRYRITKNTIDADYLFSSDAVLDSEKVNFLVPPKSLQLLSACAASQDKVEIVMEDNYIFIEIDGKTIISRYGDGKYADYDKIIPVSFGCSFIGKTADFQTAIKQVFWCVRTDLNRSINMAISPDGAGGIVKFTSKNSDGELAEYSVSIEDYQGDQEPWNQSFNGDYLLDYVSIINTVDFVWESNPGKPSVISPKDQKEKQFYLVTGLR